MLDLKKHIKSVLKSYSDLASLNFGERLLVLVGGLAGLWLSVGLTLEFVMLKGITFEELRLILILLVLVHFPYFYNKIKKEELND